MIAVVAHIEAVLKVQKLIPIWEDDDTEQAPSSLMSKALVVIASSNTDQQANAFYDDLSASIKIHHNDARKALAKVEDIRKSLTTLETTGVCGVVFNGLDIGENSYIEKMKSYKLNFQIKTISAR